MAQTVRFGCRRKKDADALSARRKEKKGRPLLRRGNKKEECMVEKLSDLPNIGPELERQLARAGVDTPEQLRALGSREAWLRIQADDPSACLHRLSALEGAVRGVKKAQLPPEVKAELKAFYRTHKG